MRKSIFLTVILALLIGSANVQAQCTENELNPAAGVPHSYEVAITNGNGYDADGTYTWYVTKSATDLLTGAMTDDSDFKATAASTTLSAYNSTTTAQTKNKLELTWKTEAIVSGDPYFLVLKYTENNGTCDAMNMKVMKITPLNQFKLDIDPVKDEAGTAFGAGTAVEVCAADVDGAAYDATANKVTYTYGENTLYYKITASGFVGKWKPQLKLPALATTGGQKYVKAEWKDAAGTWHTFGAATTAATQDLTSTDLADIPAPSTAGATPTASYIVRVVIDNERFETLANQTLNIATDGTYGGTTHTSLNDKKDNCSADEAAFADKDDYTIKARPTVGASSGAFIQEVH